VKKTPSLQKGERVTALKKIVYLPTPPETGVKIVAKGTGGTVVSVSRRGYREVRFDDGQVVDVSLKELTPPSMLDRITSAIFGD
jgi:hypothetical protein